VNPDDITTARSGPPVTYRDYFEWSHAHPRFWPTWFGISCLWLLSRLPFMAQLRLGSGLGTVLYHALPARRKITLKNLELALPELQPHERIQLAKDNYRHVGMSLAEVAIFWFRPTRWYIHRLHLHGEEHLAAAMALGKGVVLLQAHFTLVDFSASIMCQQYSAYAVYGKSKNAMFGAMLRFRRERYMQAMLVNRDIRSMIRLLKKGALIWYSPDQSVAAGRGGIAVRYFNQPAMTTPGTARIAAITGATVIPMVPTRLPAEGQYRLTFFPPLDLSSMDTETATQRVNEVFAEQVRTQPEQYFWMHKRFKPGTDQQPDPYRH